LAVLQSVIDPSFHVTETVADQECKSQLAVCAKPGCGDGGARPPGRSQDDRQGEIPVPETLLTTRTNRRAWRGSVLFIAILLLAVAANATENGGSVYPVGVETVKPGLTPPPDGSVIFEFTAFYSANQMNNSAGLSAAPEFKLRVLANAFKVVHNWNVPVLGGRLNSNLAVPVLYEELHVAPGNFSSTGLSNVDLSPFQVGYNTGSWHWYYEGDVIFPGGSYSKSDILNVGQHNYAVAPVGGFTFLPHRGAWEASSKFLYIVNFRDPATSYHGGNEFIWEYAGMREVSHHLAFGINGYLYDQTANDFQHGVVVGDGNRGRDLAVGPEVFIPFGHHSALALKYERDTLVENKPQGQAFWFQMGLPLSLERGRELVASLAGRNRPSGE
jgi:hypothetical protein